MRADRPAVEYRRAHRAGAGPPRSSRARHRPAHTRPRANPLRGGPECRCIRWARAGKRFNHRKAEPFNVAGLKHQLRMSIQRCQRFAIEALHMNDRRLEGKTVDDPPLLRGEIAADFHEQHLRMIGADGGERVEQDVDTLAGNAASDVHQVRPAANIIEHQRFARFRRGGFEFRRNPRRGFFQPRRIDQLVLQYFPTHRVGVIKHHRRLLHSTENAPGHHPIPQRPWLATGREDRPKRVQVMTKNARTLRRKRVYEHRIAVVGDMEKIEVARDRLEIDKVVVLSVEQSIEIVSGLVVGQQRPKPPAKLRANLHHLAVIGTGLL